MSEEFCTRVMEQRAFLAKCARSAGASEDQIDDFLHELLIKAWDERDKIENSGGDDERRSYLGTMMRHLVFEKFRKRQRESKHLEELQNRLTSVDEVQPLSALEHRERYEAFDDCLETLPPDDRELIKLRTNLKVKNKQIALMRGVSEPRATQLFQRAIDRFRRCMERAGYGNG